MSAPSATVIFLNLPGSADETILRAFLEEMGCKIDEVTIIKDRATGNSKRFGFVRFASVEHARSFVEPNFPAIDWKTPKIAKVNDDGNVVKIDYSQTEKPGPNRTKELLSRPQCAHAGPLGPSEPRSCSRCRTAASIGWARGQRRRSRLGHSTWTLAHRSSARHAHLCRGRRRSPRQGGHAGRQVDPHQGQVDQAEPRFCFRHIP